MFQSTLSCRTIRLTQYSKLNSGTVQFVIRLVQGLSCEFSFTVQAESSMTHRELDNGPVSCRAFRVQSFSLHLTNILNQMSRRGIPRRPCYLSFLSDSM